MHKKTKTKNENPKHKLSQSRKISRHDTQDQTPTLPTTQPNTWPNTPTPKPPPSFGEEREEGGFKNKFQLLLSLVFVSSLEFSCKHKANNFQWWFEVRIFFVLFLNFVNEVFVWNHFHFVKRFQNILKKKKTFLKGFRHVKKERTRVSELRVIICSFSFIVVSRTPKLTTSKHFFFTKMKRNKRNFELKTTN